MAKSSTASKSSTVEAATQAVEFGASIREMRQAHNRELADVAATLKIRQVYLQAIEDGRFGDLPGPTYATGFIRAYADYLGLDLAEVMRRYREITGDQPAQGPLVPPSPVVEARLPTGFILLVAAVLALGAYGGWYYLTVDGRDPVEVVAKLPERIANMVGIDQEASENSAQPTGETPTAQPAEAADVTATPASTPETSPAPSVAPATDPSATADATMAPTAMPEPTTVPDTAPVSATASAPISTPVAETPPAAVQVASEASSEASSAGTNANATARQIAEATSAPAMQAVPAAAPTAASPTEAPAATPAATPSAVVATPLPESQTAATAQEAASQAEPPPASTVAPAPEAPQIAATPSIAAPTETGAADPASASRVILRANAITWVELRDGAGKRLYSRLMKRGETYAVPAGAGAVLETGNAGGIDIVVDGSAIAPIGPVGAVRRGVLLEADALLARVPGAR